MAIPAYSATYSRKSVTAIGTAANRAVRRPYRRRMASPSPTFPSVPSLPAASWMMNRGIVSRSMTKMRWYPHVAPACRPVMMLATSTSAIMTSQAGPKAPTAFRTWRFITFGYPKLPSRVSRHCTYSNGS